MTTPEAREREFGQFDHVRAYSADGLRARLSSAGLTVTVLDYASTLPSADVEVYGLRNAAEGPVQYDNDMIYVATCR